MNKYEALIIFPESMKDSQLEDALGKVKAEVKKVGGEVESTTRLGKRAFARKMQKQDGGHYAILNLKLPGDQVRPLLARYKLNEEVFRVQIVKATEVPVQPAQAEEGKHGQP